MSGYTITEVVIVSVHLWSHREHAFSSFCIFFYLFKIEGCINTIEYILIIWVYLNFNNIGRYIKIALLYQLLVIIALKTYKKEKNKTRHKFHPFHSFLEFYTTTLSFGL